MFQWVTFWCLWATYESLNAIKYAVEWPEQALGAKIEDAAAE